MSILSIAMRAGLMTHNLNNLFKGKADIGIASKIGIITSSLQEFLDGQANISMANKLGLMTSDLQLLLDSIGRDGAIGLILGLIMKENEK